MSKRQEIRKKPVLPLWLAALAWPVGALVFPVYTLWGLAATAALSVVVYFVAARLCPVRIVTRETFGRDGPHGAGRPGHPAGR